MIPKHILVIDDEQLVTESIRRLLKKQGYNVTIAESGIDAIEKVKIKESGFDLIIADIRMPEMDGIEIIKKLREIVRKPTPEILITGYASDESLKQAEELNVADYIYKPFDITEFLNLVRKNLGK
ncbi:MAG TPA: response regulator [Candidatus Omnitrophica bacterium]|nr:response regulator [Candidatus Omnitrophota bacterium]